MTNRLALETSPYLLQHAANPVDWRPWGEEALSAARAENKPIFLSIGYAACHWCHVMAHESFEDASTAALLNRYFISIKVDREERPDLDSIYMQAVVAMTGQGGWPMSVFLTPDGVPFYCGTYFPPTPRYGIPSFKQVLASLAEAWVNQQDRIAGTRQGLLALYRQDSLPPGETPPALNPRVSDEAVRRLAAGFDAAHGGWGRAPKFPQPMALEFLLRYHARTGDATALRMVETTLNRMASGGMYDQLGGGFHRYATDASWLVPHFEKMLYDNGQLARVYLHAWQATGNPLYRRIAVETLDYVAREMTHPAGGFYSTQDADSEGQEGKFFVWTPDEIREVLGPQAALFCDAYGVTRAGNFDGRTILHIARDLPEAAGIHGLPAEQAAALLRQARRSLFEAREQRVKPGRDEKVLAAWNGLMLAAFAEAARALHRDDYARIAVRSADFALRELRAPDGRLRRSWKDGAGARLNAYLEDYTHLAEGLLELYQADFNPRWFTTARSLMDVALDHFRADGGGLYDTSDDHEALITRPRDVQDNATPSGSAMAAMVLLKLGLYTGQRRYADQAEAMLGRLQTQFERYPTAFGQWLAAFEFAVSSPAEIALIGDLVAGDLRALLGVVRTGFRPNQVVAARPAGVDSPVPLLDGREPLSGRAAAYVCRQFACQAPVADPEQLREQLA